MAETQTKKRNNATDEEFEVSAKKAKVNDLKTGSCEGPNSMYVKLVSADGYTFIILREWANISTILKEQLRNSGVCDETKIVEIQAKDIQSHILVEICKYLGYRKQYTNTFETIPEFSVTAETVVDLLTAATNLNI